MKKSIAFLALVALVLNVAVAQKKDRLSAYNYWRSGKLDKAKPLIDKACEDPTTSGEAKTWLYKAYIYNDICNSEEFKKLDPNALMIAYTAYGKASKLDKDGEFKNEIMLRTTALGGMFFNEGIGFLKQEKHDQALLYFQTAEELQKMYGNIDTLAVFGQGLCYENMKQTDKAIQSYQRVADLNYKEVSVYSSLSNLYLETKETKKAEAILLKAKQLFPEALEITTALANYYIASKQNEKALESLTAAAKADPKNHLITYALGVTYDRLQNDTVLSQEQRVAYFGKAVDAYNNTLTLNSTFSDAMYNIGVLYFNKAVDQIKRADKLPLSDDAGYKALLNDANENLKKALPFLEKCHELQPTDRDTMVSLRDIYLRLKMMDKYAAMKEKLERK